MTEINLSEPFLDQGIKNTNFFEGRLLTAEDLREQQEANRTHHRQLGRAIGAGIVEGLEVTVEKDGSDGTPPAVRINPGLAINSRGMVLELPDSYVTLQLTRTFEDAELSDTKLFDNCTLPPSTEKLPNGVGVYILVMSPASGYRERAPKSGLGDNGIVRGCGNRYAVEGVQFRLVPFDPLKLSSISEKTQNLLKGQNNDGLLSYDKPAQKSETDRLSRLRNIIAHLFFGTEELENFAADPFKRENGKSAYLKYGALDELRSIEGCLTDCDVPLALLYWTLEGIAFLDMWSVRRRPYELTPSEKWPTLSSPRRLADAEAMFFQFQEQIEQIVLKHTDPQSITAYDYFKYLPPAGFIRLRKGISQGMVPDTFFHLLPHRTAPEYIGSLDSFIEGNPQFIDGSLFGKIIHESFNYNPINLPTINNDLAQPNVNQQMVWLYYPWQQVVALEDEGGISHYLIFTVAHMPPFSIARFDVERWDRSNYGKCEEYGS